MSWPTTTSGDARYVQDVRLGGYFTLSSNLSTWNNAPAGGVLQDLWYDANQVCKSGRGSYVQKNINGVWATVSEVA